MSISDKQARRGRGVQATALALGVTALVSAGCSSSSKPGATSNSNSGSAAPSSPPSGSPVTLHAILPLTGSAAFVGVGEKTALDLVAQEVNNAGGINGGKVNVSVVDDQSQTSTAVSQASQLIQQHASIVFIGGTVAQIAPVQKLATASGPLLLALSPGTSAPAGSMQFIPGDVPTAVAPSDILNYLESKQWTRVALMHSNDPTGQGGYGEVKKALGESQYGNLKVVADETFNATDVTATNQLLAIKRANPQVLIEWSSGPPTGIVFKSMQQVGLQDLPTVESNGNANVDTMKGFTAVPTTVLTPAPNWICGTQGLSQAQVAPISDMTSAYQAAKQTPGIGTTEMWDLAQAVVAALKTKGPDASPAELTAALESMQSFNGIDTTYNFGAPDHLGITGASYRMCSWNAASGTFQPASQFGGKA